MMTDMTTAVSIRTKLPSSIPPAIVNAIDPAEVGAVAITSIAPAAVSSDRKVADAVRVTASKATVRTPNAFGLPALISCPGATETCSAICYAANLERVFTSAGALVLRNWHALQSMGDDIETMAKWLGDMLAEYVRLATMRGEQLLFRIHWDGDFFSVAYAAAWALVCHRFPMVKFWAYTRTFRGAVNVVPTLANVLNLTLYLSVDEHNADDAVPVLAEFPTVHAAVLADTSDDAAELLQRIGRNRAPVCPENVGRMPLVTDPDRRSRPAAVGTTGRGACAACRLCVDGVADVRFTVRGR